MLRSPGRMRFQTLLLIIIRFYPMQSLIRLSCKINAHFDITLENMSDPNAALKNIITQSRRECALECVSHPSCKAVNFKLHGGNCELLGQGLNRNLVEKTGWLYMTTNEKRKNVGSTCERLSPCQNGAKCRDTCSDPGYTCECGTSYSGTHCENVREFASCQAVYEAGFTTSGVYMLAGMGYHYCVMESLGECSGTGWTLVMKLDGNKKTFTYSSSKWTDSSIYNQIYGLKDGLNGEEAKFDAYNKLSFTKICLRFEYSGKFQYMQIIESQPSMRSLISSSFTATSIGRAKWLSMLTNANLQAYCNKEGFNVLGRVRIGIVGNNENECLSVDSHIGLGLNEICNPTTSGNTRCHGESVNKPIRGVILVK